jgi:hypothetical protein
MPDGIDIAEEIPNVKSSPRQTPEESYSPWREIWRSFRSDYAAMAGLSFIIILCLTAVFAPLIVNGKPLLVAWAVFIQARMVCGVRPESPEVLVEKTFNFLMCLIPVKLVLFLFLYRRRKAFMILSFIAAVLIAYRFSRTEKGLDKTPGAVSRRR